MGGLIGYSAGNVTLVNCYTTSNIIATNNLAYSDASVYAGGLVESSHGILTMENCYATGDITAKSTALNRTTSAYAGGLVGNNNAILTIKNCYATGDITAVATSFSSDTHIRVGGLVGSSINFVYNNAVSDVTMENCYATGDITAATSVAANVCAGGLIGYGDVGVVAESCYRLSSQKIIGNTINDVGTPLTFDEMKNQQSFINWNFETTWTIDPKINRGYPYLTTFNDKSLFGSFWFITLLIVAVVLVVMGIIYLLLQKRRG